MHEVFRGCATALITPFREGGEVDYEALGRLIDFQLEGGIDALVAAGTTGEASALKEEEQLQVIRFTVERCQGRVPVIAGTGSNCTAHAAALSRQAEQAGADALLVVTPYYNKTTQQGLVAHFSAIAGAVSLPVILYNVPGRTGMSIQPETLVQLCELPNIVGLKDATGDLGYAVRVRHLCGDRLALYSGNDDVAVPLLSVGGAGLISVLSNLLPRRTREMVAAFLEGRAEAAGREQVALKGLIDALFMETNPIPVKWAAQALGLCGGAVRLPLVEAQEGTRQRLLACIRQLGLLQGEGER